MLDILTAVAHVATGFGVCVAAWQLWEAHKQSVTTFEDSLVKEYREIVSTLPTKALLGDALTDQEHAEYFDEFYRYVDLCNEQTFLYQHGRISDVTWRYWSDGITSNLRRPAFRRAWAEIAARANDDFAELRVLFPPLIDADQHDAGAANSGAKT